MLSFLRLFQYQQPHWLIPSTTSDLSVTHLQRKKREEDPLESKHHWKHLLFCPVGAICKAVIICPNNWVPVWHGPSLCLHTKQKKNGKAVKLVTFDPHTDSHTRRMCVCVMHCHEWGLNTTPSMLVSYQNSCCVADLKSANWNVHLTSVCFFSHTTANNMNKRRKW